MIQEIGKILKKRRLEKHMSVKEVAAALRIRTEYLQNIEENRVEHIDAYVTGYIRMYAKFLQIDIDEQLETLKSGKHKAPEPVRVETTEEDTPASSNPSFGIVAASIVTILISALAITYLSNLGISSIDSAIFKSGAKVMIRNDRCNVIRQNGKEYAVTIHDPATELHMVATDFTNYTITDKENNIVDQGIMALHERKPVPTGHDYLLVKFDVENSLNIEEVRA